MDRNDGRGGKSETSNKPQNPEGVPQTLNALHTQTPCMFKIEIHERWEARRGVMAEMGMR